MKIIRLLITAISFVFLIIISSLAGQWTQDNNGWKYLNDDGSFLINSWHQDSDNLWYYLGADGYMKCNQWIDGKYYVSESGAMLTNTMTPDGKHVNSKGELVEGTALYEGYENYKEFEREETLFKIFYNNQYTGNETGISFLISDITLSKEGSFRATGTKVADGLDKNLTVNVTVIIENENGDIEYIKDRKLRFNRNNIIDTPEIMKVKSYIHDPGWTIKVYLGNPI